MKFINKNINTPLLIVTLFWMMMAMACRDNDLTDGDVIGDDATELSLSFSFYLDKSPATRATQLIEGNIDNYIDVNSLQVFFLTTEGDYLFSFVPSSGQVKKSEGDENQWIVTIPLDKTLKDAETGESLLNHIKLYLESNEFKIAVVCNWPQQSGVYPLEWGWNNSKLNKNASDVKNINELHHIMPDNYYSQRSNAYNFIMIDGKMGLNTDWVRYRDVDGYESMDSKEKAWYLDKAPDNSISISKNAYIWIKNNWDPVVDKQYNPDEVTAHGIYRQYVKLWQLWDFGLGFGDDEIYENLNKDTSERDRFKSGWIERNGTTFAEWCGEDGVVIGKSEDSDKENDGLWVVTNGEAGTKAASGYVSSYNQSGRYGLVLPEMTSSAINEEDMRKNKPRIDLKKGAEYLRFSVPGTGKLRVFFSSADENEASLVVQRGTNWEGTFTTSGPDMKEIGSSSGSVVEAFSSSGIKVQLTGDQEEIVLFSLKGNVLINAIEFVCDEYLSATDREGILPSESQPIPMYGIQTFKPIESWGSQKLIDISKSGDNVGLIRALAKVELYLPIGKEVRHVYLRSMNRKARCAPMDVLTSTGDLWKTHADTEDNCEWFRIFSHGSGLSTDGTSAKEFKDWFGWFFKTWESIPNSQFSFSSVIDTRESPRLFNPDVERTDFCHFIKDEKYNDGLYHRYVLYVPDKNIWDPNDAGDMTSSPKVCHIEYRGQYEGRLMSEYLDDNDCYRVYFTDYETNSEIKATKADEFETVYEKKGENLDKHWPIMRNHVYRFYVGNSNTPQEIRVKVVPFDDSEDPKKEVW